MKGTNLNITEKDNCICISASNPFLCISDFDVASGIDIADNVCILKSENAVIKSGESHIAQYADSLDYFIHSYGDVSVLTFMANDVIVQDFTESLKVANSQKGFEKARINLSHVIYIGCELSTKNLIKIYKDVTKAKSKFLAGLNLPFHIENILNTDDFLAVLCNAGGTDESSQYYPDELNIAEAVEISLEDAFERLNLTFGILDYLVGEGILIGDMVEAGMELLDGIEVTQELNEKMEAQILKSLSDINVIALIMAAIRTQTDISANGLREIDSAYLHTGDVLGIAVSNQIGGTRAAFNFRHYIELKPGIIYGLPPMLNDVFAGLIAGCITKIFEE